MTSGAFNDTGRSSQGNQLQENNLYDLRGNQDDDLEDQNTSLISEDDAYNVILKRGRHDS
jgi:prophage antirepressor-like protein